MLTDQTQISCELLKHESMKYQPPGRNQPVSSRSPGFVALAQALRCALTGGSDRGQVAEYKQALGESLQSAQDRLRQMVVPNAVASCVSPIVRNAEIMMDKLTTVLDLVDHYLYEDSGESLKEAISLLDLVHVQMKVAY